MSPAPSMPPPPESAPSRHDAWGRPMPIYLAEQMREYALAAYQAGFDAALEQVKARIGAMQNKDKP